MVREKKGKDEEEWVSTAFSFHSNRGICSKSSEYISGETIKHHTTFRRKLEVSEMHYQKKHDKS